MSPTELPADLLKYVKEQQMSTIAHRARILAPRGEIP